MNQRVVITGLGCVSPIGLGWEKFWEAALAGQSGISRILAFDPSAFSCQIAGQVRDFDPSAFMDKKEAKRLVRFIKFALAASLLALKDANLAISPESAEQVGVIIGSGVGGLEYLEDQVEVLRQKGPDRVSPFTVPMMIVDMAAGQVAIATGAKGPNLCVTTACASSTHSIGVAFKSIQDGSAQVMIAGGTEACITPLGLAGFCAARALSTRNDQPSQASRPFDAKRDGFIMGEGAGIVILENLEHAQKRGARIYAELAGYGASGDAYHMTAPAPEGEGAARAIAAALRDGGLKPADISYINAHGTSTELNDKLETQAIKKVFGEQAKRIPISSTKSMVGHLLGAAGGVEMVATVLSVHHNKIHPTINYEFPDPECDLDYVPNKMRQVEVRAALTNSFGFGGHNACLAVKKFS